MIPTSHNTPPHLEKGVDLPINERPSGTIYKLGGLSHTPISVTNVYLVTRIKYTRKHFTFGRS